MTQPTLGLLEKLRPPPGFRTEAALGATYSADLLTCMAVLITLDGGDGEQVRYGRVEAYRALDRLREKVRICHQAGRVSRRDGGKYPSLALLDRVLVPVRVPGGGSFHPKVWLVRQLGENGAERFVLIVSSRNITTSSDWDLGVAVEGKRHRDGVALPRVHAFAEHALELAGDKERIAAFGPLDDVRWTLPRGTNGMSFDFQAGGEAPGDLHAEWNSWSLRPNRALLLSPFIDERMIEEAASRWSRVPKRSLVAGTEGLLTVALSSRRESLRALEPRQVVAASEASDPPETEAGYETEDEIEGTRALHAKVIALDDGRRATVVIGSNNLTSAGWRGGSTEAFVRLTGSVSLCDPLWDWAFKQAHLFTFPEPSTPKPTQPLLERTKDRLHALLFRLEDSSHGSPSRLLLLDPPDLDLPADVRLEVCRYTMPGDKIAFAPGDRAVTLPACPAALRTRFIVCTLHHAEDEVAWITSADLHPPPDDDRDRELVARLLGLRQFLAYLQSLRSDEVIPGAIEGEDPNDTGKESEQQPVSPVPASVHLEGLLRQLVSQPEAFDEMDRAVTRYGELISERASNPEERDLLQQFLAAWSAIRDAFRP